MFEHSKENSVLYQYKFGPAIGNGTFGKVLLAYNTETGKLCALKKLSKNHLIKFKMEKYVSEEKKALLLVRGNPLFVKIRNFFETEYNIYFELSYEKNLDITHYIKKLEGFKKETAKFYAAEILLALEFLHGLNIIHRDIKPQNILLKENFHICLTDFGSCKIKVDQDIAKDESQSISSSLVGSKEIVCPEILEGKSCGSECDIWSFGVNLYYMLSNKWPFSHSPENQTYKNIKNCHYTFSSIFDDQSKDLIGSMLKYNPQERIGGENKIFEIRYHSFFEGLDWSDLLQLTPPGEVRKCQVFLPNSIAVDNFVIKSQEWCIEDEVFKDIDEQQHSFSMVPRCSLWDIYLKNRDLIKYGLVFKQKTKHHRKLRRVLIVSEGPQLIYVDSFTNKHKGTIKWDKTLTIEAQDFRKFQIQNSQRCYYFEEVADDAEGWVSAIRKVHDKYFSTQKNSKSL